jgi:hypothetical protein
MIRMTKSAGLARKNHALQKTTRLLRASAAGA